MLKFIKRVMFTFADQLAFVMITMFFLTSVLPFALEHGKGQTVFSIFSGLIYLSSLYCYFWNNSGRDYRSYKAALKRDPDCGAVFRIYYGFAAAVPIAVVNAVFAILALTKGGIMSVIYRVMNIAFLAFIIDADNELSVIWIAVVSVLPVIVCGMGYIVGKTGFSITEKYLPRLIYQKKKDDKK